MLDSSKTQFRIIHHLSKFPSQLHTPPRPLHDFTCPSFHVCLCYVGVPSDRMTAGTKHCFALGSKGLVPSRYCSMSQPDGEMPSQGHREGDAASLKYSTPVQASTRSASSRGILSSECFSGDPRHAHLPVDLPNLFRRCLARVQARSLGDLRSNFGL